MKLPTAALLGEDLEQTEYAKALRDFYHYVDLSNEQIFLRQHSRISKDAWENWADGIRSNLSKPAFRKAWDEIKKRAPDSFSELRRIEASEFRDDPHSWK